MLGLQSILPSTVSGNVAIGNGALINSTAGDQNTAVGYNALSNNNGGFNVGVGSQTLLNNISGVGNVALGYGTLLGLTGGSYNVALGYSASVSNEDSNSVVIGAGAIGAGSSTTVIKQLRDADATIFPDGPIPDAQYSNYVHYNSTSNEVTYIPEVLYVSDASYNLTAGASNQQLTIIANKTASIEQLSEFLQFAEAGGTVTQGDDFKVFALSTDGGSNVFVGGQFSTLDGNVCNSIATFSQTGVFQNNLNNGFTYNFTDIPATVKTIYYDSTNVRIYAGGQMFNINGGVTPINCISYYDTSLSAWQQMGSGTPGINNTYFVNTITSNNTTSNIYFGGDFPNDSNGSTLNGIGYYDPGLNTLNPLQGITYGVTQVSTTPVVNALFRVGDYIYVGGTFKSAGGVQANNVARYDLNNQKWEALWDTNTNRNGVNGVNDVVNAITYNGSTGDVYFGGVFTTAGGKSCTNVAYWNPSSYTWSHTGGTGPIGTVHALEYGFSDSAGSVPVIFVGGAFPNVGLNVAYWDGSSYNTLPDTGGSQSPIGEGVGGTVYALKYVTIPSSPTPLDGYGIRRLYVGGSFSAVSTGNSAQGYNASNIGCWNVDGTGGNPVWIGNATGYLPLTSGVNEPVRALTYADSTITSNVTTPTLYVGGDFTVSNYNGTTPYSTPYISEFSIGNNQWNPLGNDGNNYCSHPVLALSLNVDGGTGGKLQIGGQFTTVTASTISANHVVFYNFSTNGWEPFTTGGGGNGVNNTVRALGYTYLNSPYVPGAQTTIMGGDFTVMDVGSSSPPEVNANLVGMYSYQFPASFNNLSYINPSVGLGLTAGTSTINALKMIGTDLYVGGYFDSFGPDHNVGTNNPNVYNIAKWDTIERVWYPLVTSNLFSPGVGLTGNIGPTTSIRTLETNGTKLYVGGDFFYPANFNSPSLTHIGEWDPTTETWTPFTFSPFNGFNNVVNNIYYNSNILYATGTFTFTSGNLLECRLIAKMDTSTYIISAIENTSPPLISQKGFQLTTAGTESGNAILYFSPNIYFGGFFNVSAPTPAYSFSRSSYLVPYIAPVPDQVIINTSGCSFINSSNGQTTTSYTLNNQYEDVHLIFDTSANAWLTVYGSQCGCTGPTGSQGPTGYTGSIGPTGPGGPGGALGYWGSFWSDVSQNSITPNAEQAMTLNRTDLNSNGVSIVNNSQITVANSGVYNIQFSAQVQDTNNPSNDPLSIWFKKNGVVIPESATNLTVDNQNPYYVASWNYMLKLDAGEYIEIFWYSIDTGMSLVAVSAAGPIPAIPAIPSVIVTVQQVMNTQLGPTGPAGGPIGPTGPTGTPGTSGVSSGLILYMNYSEITAPSITNLINGTLPVGIITPTNPPIPNPSFIPSTPENPTQIRLLSLTPNAAIATDIRTRINSDLTDLTQEWLAQFAIYKSDLPGQTFIPPGIWDMNIFADAVGAAVDQIGLQFHLYGVTVSGGDIVVGSLTEFGAGSSIEYVTGTGINLYTLSLIIPTNIDLSSYNALYIIVTAVNKTSTNRTVNIFFESPLTYSHIHTSFGVIGYTGPTGAASSVTGPTGPTGPSNPNSTSVTITDISNNVLYYPTFALASGANQPLYADITSVPLTYNPSTGYLTTTTVVGDLSGNLIGGATGSIPYQSAANVTSLLAAGPTGSVLTSSGPNLIPTWSGFGSKPPFAEYRQTPVGVAIAAGATYAFLFANGTGYNGMPTIGGGGSATTTLLLPQTGYYKVMCRTNFIYNSLAVTGTGSISSQLFINTVASLADSIGYLTPTPTVSYGAYPLSAYFSVFSEGIVYVSAVDGANNALTCSVINGTTTVATVVTNFANIFKISD